MMSVVIPFMVCVCCLILGVGVGYYEGKDDGWRACSKFYRGDVLPKFVREIKRLRKKMK